MFQQGWFLLGAEGESASCLSPSELPATLGPGSIIVIWPSPSQRVSGPSLPPSRIMVVLL